MSLSDRYSALLAKISAAGRPVTLLAVSKGQSAEAIRELYGLGHRDFGENYVQELCEKAAALADCPELRWHFIGHLQTNKVKVLLPLVYAIHTIDSLKLAAEVAKRFAGHEKIRVFLEVNLDGEATKSGFAPADIANAARDIRAQFPALDVRGLMAIPATGASPRDPFRRLAELGRACGTAELSMGMSGDFEAAILEGATHVRVGTALFGPRSPRV